MVSVHRLPKSDDVMIVDSFGKCYELTKLKLHADEYTCCCVSLLVRTSLKFSPFGRIFDLILSALMVLVEDQDLILGSRLWN